MCFSASASFAAGTALVAVGAVTLSKAGHRAELGYAAIPLLFGVQQLIEGVIWLTFRFDAPLVNAATTFAYSSSHRSVKLFGLAALLSFIGAYAAYAKWFISVWCFFAAVLSVIVLLHFTNRTSRAKEPAHGMAV